MARARGDQRQQATPNAFKLRNSLCYVVHLSLRGPLDRPHVLLVAEVQKLSDVFEGESEGIRIFVLGRRYGWARCR